MSTTEAWHPSLASIVEESTATALATRLAADVAMHLQTALEQRGKASLMVSGGSTPLPFFHALSAAELDWPNVTVSLVDERYVEASHADSNEKLVRENLLCNNASAAEFQSVVSAASEGSGNKGASDLAGIEAVLSGADTMVSGIRAGHEGKFDVVVLGMGGDGHTASLFPRHEGNGEVLEDSLLIPRADSHNCCTMHPGTAPHQRISLNLDAICASRTLIVHITGDGKRQVLNEALKAGDVMAKPIAAVFAKAAPVVYWAA